MTSRRQIAAPARCTYSRPPPFAAWLLLTGGIVAFGWALALALAGAAASIAADPLASSLLLVAQLVAAFGGLLLLAGLVLDHTGRPASRPRRDDANVIDAPLFAARPARLRAPRRSRPGPSVTRPR